MNLKFPLFLTAEHNGFYYQNSWKMIIFLGIQWFKYDKLNTSLKQNEHSGKQLASR